MSSSDADAPPYSGGAPVTGGTGLWVPPPVPPYEITVPTTHDAPPAASSPTPTPAPATVMQLRGEGMVFRFGPLRGITPKAVLQHRIWLPVVLNTFTVQEDKLHNEYDTLSAGQFSQAAQGGQNATRLRTSSLDTVLVDMYEPWIVAAGQSPQMLRSALYRIMRSGKPVHLLATFHPNPDPHPEFDGNVTLRSISKDVRPAERDSRYLTITVSEWRDPRARVRHHNPQDELSRKHVPLPATHRLTAEDTLYDLSYEYYGVYKWWKRIRDANHMPKKMGAKEPIARLGGKWVVGAKIKIPRVPLSHLDRQKKLN